MDKSRLRALDDMELLRHGIESLREGFYVCDEQGSLLDANSAFLEIFGATSLEGLPFTEEFLPARRQSSETGVVSLFEASAEEIEFTLRRLDGNRRTVLERSFSLRDPETKGQLHCGILTDITEQRELEQRLETLEVRDPLTGCYSRRYLKVLEQLIVADVETSRWGAIVVDIDHFRAYNEEHGASAGDTMLIKVSRFLMRLVRAEDPVLRFGGDEFLVLMLRKPPPSMATIARRFQTEALKSAPLPLSMGWAVRQHQENLLETIERADQKLIKIRSEGRGERRETSTDLS